MQVLTTRPARVAIDQHIKRIVIVNRSIGNEKSVIEGVLTGELPGKDTQLSRYCIQGVMQELSSSSRFTVVAFDKELPSGNPTSTSFGPALTWNSIADICRRTGADAVLTLEFFDSDYTLLNAGKAAKTNDKVVVNNTTEPLFYATGTASANAGFRIYNNLNRSISYEDSYRYNREWRQSARTYLEAASKLMKKNEAMENVSRDLGANFSRMLIPTRYWENRLMFKGKSALAVKAERLALTSNWEEAVSVWLQAYSSATEPKERGAIAYNLALGYEVLGEYESAKKWVSTSYIDSGNSKALRYSEIIDGLIADRKRLNSQLGN